MYLIERGKSQVELEAFDRYRTGSTGFYAAHYMDTETIFRRYKIVVDGDPSNWIDLKQLVHGTANMVETIFAFMFRDPQNEKLYAAIAEEILPYFMELGKATEGYPHGRAESFVTCGKYEYDPKNLLYLKFGQFSLFEWLNLVHHFSVLLNSILCGKKVPGWEKKFLAYRAAFRLSQGDVH